MPSVCPMSTPDGLGEEPKDRRSLYTDENERMRSTRARYTPNFQEGIVGCADKHIARRSIRPAATIDIVFVSLDLDRTLFGYQVVDCDA